MRIINIYKRCTENELPISILISKVVQQITQLLQTLFLATPVKGKSDIMYKRFIHYTFKILFFQIFFWKFEAFLASSKYWDRTRRLGTLSETKIQYIIQNHNINVQNRSFSICINRIWSSTKENIIIHFLNLNICVCYVLWPYCTLQGRFGVSCFLGGVKWRAKLDENFSYPPSPQNFYPGGKICLGGLISPPAICWQG